MAGPVSLDEVDNTQLTEDDLSDVYEMVASLRNRADDLGIALKLSPSFCDGRVGLRTILLEWLRENGREPPTWRGLVKAVESPVGGRNPALAKRIVRQLIEKKASTPVVATPVAEGQMFSQTNSLPTNVSVSRQEVRGNVSQEKILTHPQQATSSLPASITTGTTLSSTGQLDSLLSITTSPPSYDTLSHQESSPGSTCLVSSTSSSMITRSLPDRSMSLIDPSIDQESNDPTVAGQQSEPAESDTNHTEQDAMSPVSNTHPSQIQDTSIQHGRVLTGDGGGDSEEKVEECDGQHEEVSDLDQLRHTETDSGSKVSDWLDSIKRRQRKMKHIEDENPYSEFMSPYPMVSPPKKHGLAIVINIANVAGLPTRSGSKEDEKNLDKLFKTLQYDVVVKTDLNSNAIRCLFLQLRDKNFQECDSFVCCILTHGTMDYFSHQDSILGADGSPLTVRELKELLIANDTLTGKPKLFFIQACRGNQMMPARQMVKPDGGGGPKTYIDERQYIHPYYSDVFVGYATTPGMQASRDSRAYKEGDIEGEAGSWYIIELCSVLTTLYKTHDLVSMVTIVHDILARDSRYLKAMKHEKNKWYRQAGQFESTLTRPFRFELEAPKPGTDSTDAPTESSPEP